MSTHVLHVIDCDSGKGLHYQLVGTCKLPPVVTNELSSGVTWKIRHVQRFCTQIAGVFSDSCEKPARVLELREGGRVF